MPTPKLELLPLVCGYRDNGETIQVVWQGIERLMMNGREIAKVKTIPGAAIATFPHVELTGSEKQAISDFLAEKRGKPPERINCLSLLYERLNEDDDEDETEIDSE